MIWLIHLYEEDASEQAYTTVLHTLSRKVENHATSPQGIHSALGM